MKLAAHLLKPNGVLFALCFSLLPLFHLSAQEKMPPPIDIHKILLSDTIPGRVFYSSSNSNIPAGKITTLPFSPIAPENIFRQLSPAQTQQFWYLYFRLENSSDTAVSIYFFPGRYAEKISLYLWSDSAATLLGIAPELPPSGDSMGYRKLTLPPHSVSGFYAGLRFARTSTNVMGPRLISIYYQPVYGRNYKIPVNNSTMYSYIIVGILLMMIIYSMAVFMMNGTFEFLYYSCYAFFMSMLFFLKSYYFNSITPFNFFFESYLDFIIQGSGTFFYLLFMRKFIDAKNRFPFLHRLLVFSQVLTIIGLVIFSSYYFLSDNFQMQDLAENITKILWTPVTVLFIIYSFARNNRLLNYLSVGQLFLLVSGIVSLALIHNPAIKGYKLPPILTDSLFYYELGITIELIFFLMALVFKNRYDLIERTRERERLKLDNERKEFEKQLAVVEAKQEERNRISADMHDELGSGVTAIRLMSEIVKTKMQGSALPEIEKISNSANDLLGKMNTIIWTMSSSNDKLDNLVVYTRSYALEFFENTGIDCHFENPEQVPAMELTGEKRRNIFLCIKESLNNVLKHSRASDVWVSFVIQPGVLEIKIRDNGIGINVEKVRQFGNGLINMKKRIESIDGSFSITKNSGTITVFAIPLR